MILRHLGLLVPCGESVRKEITERLMACATFVLTSMNLGMLKKCLKRPKPQLNALVVNDLDVNLTEEV